MRLRAQIMIEVDAADFIEAAEHQKVLEHFLQQLEGPYPGTVMKFWERRERKSEAREGAAFGAQRPVNGHTGRLHNYSDA